MIKLVCFWKKATHSIHNFSSLILKSNLEFITYLSFFNKLHRCVCVHVCVCPSIYSKQAKLMYEMLRGSTEYSRIGFEDRMHIAMP